MDSMLQWLLALVFFIPWMLCASLQVLEAAGL